MSNIKLKIDIVTVGSTSKTFATLLGAALRTSTKKVTIRPHVTGIYTDDETASINSDPLGMSPVEIAGGPSELGEVEFYAAVNTKMTIIQEG